MNFLSALLSAIGNLLGFAKQREELKNSPEMKANRVAQKDNTREAQIAKEEDAAHSGDQASLDQLRKDLGE